MTEPKDLLLVNEQLRRSNCRWKTLALAAWRGSCPRRALRRCHCGPATNTSRACHAGLTRSPGGGSRGRESGAAEVMHG